ncbi:MAG: TRAP transporter small permease [Rhizobiaceae bacterium]|nr:TRAP transporter small permease [Rhizobiaceae bacterium]
MHAVMLRLARILAIFGGVVLSALILLTCASVIGREINATLNGEFFQQRLPGFANWLLNLGVGPVNGDFELVETGVAFAIFAFLPLCQITAGHATVDIFTSKMSAGANRLLRAIADILFAAVLVLILWRLFEGTISKYSSGETTFLLQFPVWWGYVVSLFAASVGALIGIYVACVRVLEFSTASTLLIEGEGSDN